MSHRSRGPTTYKPGIKPEKLRELCGIPEGETLPEWLKPPKFACTFPTLYLDASKRTPRKPEVNPVAMVLDGLPDDVFPESPIRMLATILHEDHGLAFEPTEDALRSVLLAACEAAGRMSPDQRVKVPQGAAYWRAMNKVTQVPKRMKLSQVILLPEQEEQPTQPLLAALLPDELKRFYRHYPGPFNINRPSVVRALTKFWLVEIGPVVGRANTELPPKAWGVFLKTPVDRFKEKLERGESSTTHFTWTIRQRHCLFFATFATLKNVTIGHTDEHNLYLCLPAADKLASNPRISNTLLRGCWKDAWTQWKSGALPLPDKPERARVLAHAKPVLEKAFKRHAPGMLAKMLERWRLSEEYNQRMTEHQKANASRDKRRAEKAAEKALLREAKKTAIDLVFHEENQTWQKLGEVAALYHSDRDSYKQLFDNGQPAPRQIPTMQQVFQQTLNLLDTKYFSLSRSMKTDPGLGTLQLFFSLGFGDEPIPSDAPLLSKFLADLDRWTACAYRQHRLQQERLSIEGRGELLRFLQALKEMPDGELKRGLSDLSEAFE